MALTAGTRLKRAVALKVLPPSMATDFDRLVRIAREAETLAELNHPNIAAIYGVEGAESKSRTRTQNTNPEARTRKCERL